MAKQIIDLIVNGDKYKVAIDPWRSLAEMLRQDLRLTGTKIGCNQDDCGAGMILSAKALLDKNPQPTDREIRRGLSGNLCRCSGYTKIVEAIDAAAQRLALAPEGK